MNYKNEAYHPEGERRKKLKGAEAHEEISMAEQDQCLARMPKPDYPMDGFVSDQRCILSYCTGFSQAVNGTVVNAILMVGKTESLPDNQPVT
jgi:hypothetical protein